MVRNKNRGLKRLRFGEYVNLFFLTVLSALMLYPIVNVLAVSLTPYSISLRQPWIIFPRQLNLEGYTLVVKDPAFWRSYWNSVLVTFGHTAIGLTLTILTAWPLARKELKGKPFFVGILIFTMVFSAGLVPGYLNIKDLKLLNTLWAVLLPGITAYNCIIMINFFRNLPYELVESAFIDGASEPYILTRVVLPLSMPVIASISLFLAVGMWNGYFNAQIYLKDRDLWPMALYLKELLLSVSQLLEDAQGDPGAMQNTLNPKVVQYASIIISTLPIMSIYPFLQKHFAKGVMVGSIKG